MTLYEQLQLNQSGSQLYIKESPTIQEKRKRMAVYVFKVLLTVLFCVSFVTAFTHLFGAENGTAGVVVLLFLMAFRQVDFAIKPTHGAVVMLLIGLILTFVPHWAAGLSPLAAFPVHAVAILLLMVLGCHQPQFYNQATIVLSYLLLFGYDVSGPAYQQRVIGLLLGFGWTAWLLYRVHGHKQYEEGFWDLFRQFHIKTDRSRWQLGLSVTVALSLLAGELLGLPRVMWIGLAALSVIQPTKKERLWRAKNRCIGVICGVLCFSVLLYLLPPDLYGMLGILGGICVGFTAHYGQQSAFNCFGAIAIAASILGTGSAMLFRIVDTVFGVGFALCFYALFDHLCKQYVAKTAVSS